LRLRSLWVGVVYSKKSLTHKISEKGELIAVHLSAVEAVCVAGYFGINPPGFVVAVVALTFGLTATSFFFAIFFGFFMNV
jgi:cation/acetate symporter